MLMHSSRNIYYQQKLAYLESIMDTLVFDILICRKWLGNNHKQYATLTCIFFWTKKCNLKCPNLKIHNKIYRNVSFLNTSPKMPGRPLLHYTSMGNLCMFNNSYLASRKICDPSLGDNVCAKTKWQEGVTQDALSCHLVCYPKSTSFV